MTDLNKLRSEFEALPLIKEKLNAVYFDETLNSYFAAMINSSPTVKYVQGAWMAWQEKAKAQAVPDTHINISKDVAKRTIGHIATAMCHPNNTRSEEDVMVDDQEYICRAIKASESGAEG
ncbi:hypothetical protein [Acinetobacter baumannii]|uniref:hypothetical protein n=1 Tax=Acinetobacter baumannii TaxID=470 RepID=UPI000DD0EB0A|nr:hypothetical protein [Acinetobacter baumannii]